MHTANKAATPAVGVGAANKTAGPKKGKDKGTFVVLYSFTRCDPDHGPAGASTYTLRRVDATKGGSERVELNGDTFTRGEDGVWRWRGSRSWTNTARAKRVDPKMPFEKMRVHHSHGCGKSKPEEWFDALVPCPEPKAARKPKKRSPKRLFAWYYHECDSWVDTLRQVGGKQQPRVTDSDGHKYTLVNDGDEHEPEWRIVLGYSRQGIVTRVKEIKAPIPKATRGAGEPYADLEAMFEAAE